MRPVSRLLVSVLLGVVQATLARAEAEQVRTVPARIIPVPETVSAQMQSLIARGPMTPVAPRTAAEWKALRRCGIRSRDEADRGAAPALQRSGDRKGNCRRALLRSDAERNSDEESQSAPGHGARRRLRVWSWRSRQPRGDHHGWLRSHAGAQHRLSDASGLSIPGGNGRCDGRLEGGRGAREAGTHRALRFFHGRRDDAPDGAACEGGRPAAPGGDCARNTVV